MNIFSGDVKYYVCVMSESKDVTLGDRFIPRYPPLLNNVFRETFMSLVNAYYMSMNALIPNARKSAMAHINQRLLIFVGCAGLSMNPLYQPPSYCLTI